MATDFDIQTDLVALLPNRSWEEEDMSTSTLDVSAIHPVRSPRSFNHELSRVKGAKRRTRMLDEAQ